MTKCVIFDLDDTLAPELSFVKSGYAAVAKELASQVLVASYVNSAIDTNILNLSPQELFIYGRLLLLFDESPKNVFNRFFESFSIDYNTEDIKTLIQIYREHKPFTEVYKIYSDVLEVLNSLQNNDIRICILSDGFSVSQHNKANALNFYEKNTTDNLSKISLSHNVGYNSANSIIFDRILFTGDYGDDYMKPSEKGFINILNSLDIKAEEAIYVGDNPKKDFYIKSKLPIKCVRIVRPQGVYANADYLEGVREDYRIEDMHELLKILNII